MRLLEFADAASFLKVTSPRLLEREAENNLLLSSAITLAKASVVRSARLSFFVVEDSTGVLCSGLNVVGKRIVLSRAPKLAVEFMAEELYARETKVSGVFGPDETAADFSAAWTAATRKEFGGSQKQVAFKLEALAGADSATGLCRVAQKRDLKQVLAWAKLFVEESAHDESLNETEEAIRRSLENRQLFVWEDHRTVAMAGYGGLTPNGVRVNMVYTDRSARSRGYASSLVQALSHRLLNQTGKRFCFLFADAGNPAATKVYTRLGYQTIGEFSDYKPGSSVSTTGK